MITIWSPCCPGCESSLRHIPWIPSLFLAGHPPSLTHCRKEGWAAAAHWGGRGWGERGKKKKRGGYSYTYLVRAGIIPQPRRERGEQVQFVQWPAAFPFFAVCFSKQKPGWRIFFQQKQNEQREPFSPPWPRGLAVKEGEREQAASTKAA